MRKSLHLVSLGCNKNLVDAEVMLHKLRSYDITQDPTKADLIIINTCAFIEGAKQESIENILNLHSIRKPHSTLLVSGCLSERYKQSIAKLLPEVDIFTGLGDYARIDEILASQQSRFSEEVFLIKNEQRQIANSLTHAFIKLSEGCNQKCSFCAIPSFRKNLHSRAPKTILNEIKRLQKYGYHDFSLIAQDSSSYMHDMGQKNALSKLIQNIDKNVQNPYERFRILYLYPSSTSLDLIRSIADAKSFAPYFDMPIQHASDAMLKIMKRGAGMKKIRPLIEAMRNIDGAWLRTAFIIGHPSEKKQDFAQIINLINEEIFDSISVFAYSKEDGTQSAKMRSISRAIVSERMNTIEELLATKLAKTLQGFKGKKLLASIMGESEQSEHLIEAKILDFSNEIDPTILITQSDYPLRAGDLVQAQIKDTSPPFLLANVVKIVRKYEEIQ
ncbi:MAG: 30S ribosomal protein S12 methylthiotransferase RimO [Deltaproteobacteria bacterium]|nr:MAG: 30S ribosomal protein S12 methylthiotransferase RimO [Deltaproteobacteria bacterium]